MTSTPANDNARPAWFDTLLIQYDGFIRAKCAAYPDSDDLRQDVLLRVMERWHQYRRNGNFAAWLGYHIRSVRPEQARRERRGEKYPFYNPPQSREAPQEYYATISSALSKMTKTESTSVILSAAGYTLREIGAQRGASKQAALCAVRSGTAKLAASDNVKVRKKHAAA